MRRPSLFLSALALLVFSSGCPKAPDAADPNDGKSAATRAIIETSALPAILPAPLPDDGLGVTVHRLDNGLTVYISPNTIEPRVSAWIAVRAGSRHDPADSTGLAHYLEHMLFKGTDEMGTLDAAAEAPHIERIAALYDELEIAQGDEARAAIMAEIDAQTQASAKYAIPNELDQLYARMGIGGVNAFTSDEQTVYIADVPKNHFEAFIKVEAKRFRDPVFRLFFPELESVYEEKNISLDRPIIRVHENLYAGLFPEHPYGTQPTIGLVDHLKTPAYGDMVAYFRRWYTPNNIAIVLAGDIDAATALPVIEKYFGSWAPKQLEPPAPGRLPAIAQRKQIDITATGESAVYMGWQTAAVGHEDAAVFEVVDLLMDNAATGLINVNLVLSQKLPEAGSYSQPMREAGVWIMYGVARDGQSLSEVENLLWGVIDKLAQGEFTQADLDAIVLHQEMREMRESESNDARVQKITDSYINHIPWPDAARHSDKLRQVTREQVMAAAARALSRDHVVVVHRQNGEHAPPKIPKPTITPVAIDTSRKSEFARAVEAMPAQPIAPEWLKQGTHYQRRDLATGPMLAVHNRRNQLFSVQYLFDLGSRQEPLMCFALDLMAQSGVGELDAAALQRKLYAMGTTVTTRCDVDSLSITVEGIDREFENSVALVYSWLSNAALSDDIRSKLVANEISKRKDETDDPAGVSRALMYYAGRSVDSRYLHQPSNHTLLGADAAQLSALLSALADSKHDTLYFGPRTADAAAGAIALGTGKRALAERPTLTYRKTQGARIFFMHKDMAQARVSIFIPDGAPLPAGERPGALLYSEYVGGGMGALIFQEMREARGLAYSAWAGFVSGARARDHAALMGVIGTQADKTLDALTTMLDLLRNLPVQEARLHTAKSALEAEYRAKRIDPRSIADEVHAWDELGLSEDPRPGYWQAIEAMDGAALAGFAERFGTRPLIISILGDRSRINLEALSKIAPIEEVSLPQIFSY